MLNDLQEFCFYQYNTKVEVTEAKYHKDVRVDLREFLSIFQINILKKAGGIYYKWEIPSRIIGRKLSKDNPIVTLKELYAILHGQMSSPQAQRLARKRKKINFFLFWLERYLAEDELISRKKLDGTGVKNLGTTVIISRGNEAAVDEYSSATEAKNIADMYKLLITLTNIDR